MTYDQRETLVEKSLELNAMSDILSAISSHVKDGGILNHECFDYLSMRIYNCNNDLRKLVDSDNGSDNT